MFRKISGNEDITLLFLISRFFSEDQIGTEVIAKVTKFGLLKNAPMCQGHVAAWHGKGPFIINALVWLHRPHLLRIDF